MNRENPFALSRIFGRKRNRKQIISKSRSFSTNIIIFREKAQDKLCREREKLTKLKATLQGKNNNKISAGFPSQENILILSKKQRTQRRKEEHPRFMDRKSGWG